MSNAGLIESVTEILVEGKAKSDLEVVEGGIVIARLSPKDGAFRYALPARFRDGAKHIIHFKSAESGRPVQGSPVTVHAKGESSLIPYHTSDFTGRRALVLAPHPDDETLGCGGALLLHRDTGDDMKVVFLTDGSAGGGKLERESEAQEACSRLGVSDYEFWSQVDRQLTSNESIVDRLCHLLESFQPELVYCPSPWEYHPDHRATCEIFLRASRRLALKTDVLFYELGRPLPVNALVDVSKVMGELMSICELYRSQMKKFPYQAISEGLSRYRSHTVSSQGVTHCEGFYHTTAGELAVSPPLAVPVGPCRLATSHPSELVSIVVRTKDRPQLLKQAVKSLAAQTYSRLEVIVVNDGGAEVDSSLDELSDCFVRLEVLELAKGVGRSEAANIGMEKTTGTFLGVLDDDDLLYPEHLSKLVGFLTTTGASFAYSDCERSTHHWEQDRFVEDSLQTPFHSRSFDRDELYFENYIPSMAALFRRGLWEKSGPFDTTLEALEDWDLWIRMSAHCSFSHLPGVTAHYRVFGRRDYDFQEATLKVYDKHSDYWNVENLARRCWPGLQALKEENKKAELRFQSLEEEFSQFKEEFHKLRGHSHCLEAELAVYQRPVWKRMADRLLSWIGEKK